jgi:hypothetical protein
VCLCVVVVVVVVGGGVSNTDGSPQRADGLQGAHAVAVKHTMRDPPSENNTMPYNVPRLTNRQHQLPNLI